MVFTCAGRTAAQRIVIISVVCCFMVALPNVSFAQSRRLPSEVFFFRGHDWSRDHRNRIDERTRVANGVILRGWLLRSDVLVHFANFERHLGYEDVHYHLLIDPDFIAERYGRHQPSVLSDAVLPGNRSDSSTWRIPFEDRGIGGTRPGITVNSFWLPGNDPMTTDLQIKIELNAWHRVGSSRGPFHWNYDGRGPAPDGWVHKECFPNVCPSGSELDQAADSWWPWDPVMPDGRHYVAEGDYVEVTGSLRQDVFHGGPSEWELEVTPADPAQGWTFDRSFRGHGGHLEVHPPDSITFLDRRERPRKKAIMVISNGATDGSWMRMCPEGNDSRERHRHLSWTMDEPSPPFGGRVNTGLTPSVEVLVDGRFSDTRTFNASWSRPVGNEDCIQVLLDQPLLPIPPRYKATYIISWDAITVASVTPDRGPNTGGTLVTINGTNFTANSIVSFVRPGSEGMLATQVTYVSPTTLTATTPPGAPGPVDVRVTAGGQTGTLPNGFTYVPHPAQVMSIIDVILN